MHVISNMLHIFLTCSAWKYTSTKPQTLYNVCEYISELMTQQNTELFQPNSGIHKFNTMNESQAGLISLLSYSTHFMSHPKNRSSETKHEYTRHINLCAVNG